MFAYIIWVLYICVYTYIRKVLRKQGITICDGLQVFINSVACERRQKHWLPTIE